MIIKVNSTFRKKEREKEKEKKNVSSRPIIIHKSNSTYTAYSELTILEQI